MRPLDLGLRGCGRADSDGLLLQGFAVLWVLAQGLFRAVSWIYGFISDRAWGSSISA